MAQGFLLRVRATPGASRASVGGKWAGPNGDTRLVVRVTAAPEKGKANKAAAEAIAKAFGLPKSAVSITAGETDRLKTFALDGDPGPLAARLAALLEE
ncbi:MAG: hypothetical protein A3E78_00185 [Alphaproteobacteria bacterium RIFCSPHIGHO2_12_FULL_63_12]|nr:MAG: hypothetical protein A3E78_00185 [Alphaproteobacteria bacterium RIFCSPHIGHO2_12_FULL_63_12]